MQPTRIIFTVALVASTLLGQHRASADSTREVRRSDVGPATVHGTTRGHQRKVVYLNGAWVVAYSNEHGSHLRISRAM